MTDKQQRYVALALTLTLLGLNLAALNYLVAGWSTARLDLTEGGVFSISRATKRLLASLDEDLRIYGYFSRRTHPKLAPLVPEIVDLLDEYRAVARGRVHVEIIDPGEDEVAEQEAADRFGVHSTPFRLASKYESGIVNAYFALVVRYGDQYERYSFQDLIDVEPLPDGDIDVRLRNLEYDLTRAIKKVVYGFRGSAELFERVEEPVRLTAIVSPDSLPEVLQEVPVALRKAAEELADKGGDKFIFEEVDPSQNETVLVELEQRLGRIPPMSLGFFGEETFYLYGLLEIGGSIEQLILTGEALTAATIRETVENSLRRHTPGFLKTVGVFTPEPMEIPPEIRAQLQLPPQPPPEFQEIKRFLGQDYTVRDIQLDGSRGVPSEVDVLLVLKPQNLSEEQVYALDQYLMRGGRIVLCAGNYDAGFGGGSLTVSPMETGLDDWLAHYGIRLDRTLVLDDRNQALPLPEVRYTPLGQMRTWTLAPYPYLVQVRDDGFLNRDVTASLDAVGIYWGSPITVDDEKTADLEVVPILQSSERSWTDDDVGRVAYVDYEVPAEGTEPRMLAVALGGRFHSFYAGRPAPGSEPPDAPVDDETGESEIENPAPTSTSVPLEQSPETRLVVVGNAAFLSDFVARQLAQIDGGFFAENLRFVENLIDWVSLDNELIAIRSRGVTGSRLRAVGKRTEVTVEAVNYLVPLGALIALGAGLHYRRRNTVSVLAAAAGAGQEEEE